MTASTRNGLTSLRGCGKDVRCRRFCFHALFTPVIRAVLVSFSEDPDIAEGLDSPRRGPWGGRRPTHSRTEGSDELTSRERCRHCV